MVRTFFINFFFLVASFGVLSSCHEKGCTDPTAVNYDVTADEDDGSCIICSTTEQPYDYVEIYLEDENWNSPHYNETVAKFELYQNIVSPTHQVCGNNTSSVTLKVRSLVNQPMYFQYYIVDYTGPVNINITGAVMLEPFAVSEEGKYELDDMEPFLPIGLDSIRVILQNNITYY